MLDHKKHGANSYIWHKHGLSRNNHKGLDNVMQKLAFQSKHVEGVNLRQPQAHNSKLLTGNKEA